MLKSRLLATVPMLALALVLVSLPTRQAMLLRTQFPLSNLGRQVKSDSRYGSSHVPAPGYVHRRGWDSETARACAHGGCSSMRPMAGWTRSGPVSSSSRNPVLRFRRQARGPGALARSRSSSSPGWAASEWHAPVGSNLRAEDSCDAVGSGTGPRPYGQATARAIGRHRILTLDAVRVCVTRTGRPLFVCLLARQEDVEYARPPTPPSTS